MLVYLNGPDLAGCEHFPDIKIRNFVLLNVVSGEDDALFDFKVIVGREPRPCGLFLGLSSNWTTVKDEEFFFGANGI